MSAPARPPGGHAPSHGEDVAQRQEGSQPVAPARPPGGRAPSHGEDVAQRQESGQPVAPALEVRGLTVHYGHIEAVRGIDLALEPGGITALVGANGAGKSTTLLALSGLLPKLAGSVIFEGEDITRLAPHQIVARGIVQVPEGRAILATMTVRENLELGAYRLGGSAASKDFDYVFALFPRLKERLDGVAGNLSGGEQQMLAIARALMAKPRLLLLDEPSMGLAPIVVQEIFRALRSINADGLTLFLVEQNVRQALKIAQRGYVLENGSLALSGSGKELLNHPRVLQAYLGV